MIIEKPIVNACFLSDYCNNYYKVGDVVRIKMTEVPFGEIQDSFAKHGGRFATVIFAGKDFITVKYGQNPDIAFIGYGGTCDLSWTESFGRLELAQGNVVKVK